MISGLTDGLLTGEGDGQNNDYRYDAEQGQHNKYQVEEQVDGFVCTVKLLKARLVIGFGVIVLPPYIIAPSGSIRRTIQLAIRIVAHPRTDCTNAVRCHPYGGGFQLFIHHDIDGGRHVEQRIGVSRDLIEQTEIGVKYAPYGQDEHHDDHQLEHGQCNESRLRQIEAPSITAAS